MTCQAVGELVKRLKALEDRVIDTEQLRRRVEIIESWQSSIVDSLHELDVRISELKKLRGDL
jgi:exoribonuclease R